jgi:hypothetical protein
MVTIPPCCAAPLIPGIVFIGVVIYVNVMGGWVEPPGFVPPAPVENPGGNKNGTDNNGSQQGGVGRLHVLIESCLTEFPIAACL